MPLIIEALLLRKRIETINSLPFTLVNNPTKVTPEKQSLYFPCLDGIRFILIIIVMGYHIEGVFETRPAISVSSFFDGKLAVDVFFVISGFLITYVLMAEQDRFGKISLRGFYARCKRRANSGTVAGVIPVRFWFF